VKSFPSAAESEKNRTNQTDMKEIIEFLQSCPAYFIATEDKDQPRVRPFTSLVEFEGRLYIQSAHNKDFAKQVAANPKVELCAFDGKSRWVRIHCTLVDDPRVEPKKAMLDAMPELRTLGYDEHDANTAVYYMDKAEAVFYSYTSAPRTVRF